MPGKVAIIDRSGSECQALKAQLEAAYFEVREYEYGDDAFTELSTEKVDTILMGVDLEGSCGIINCRSFRSHKLFYDIPIVLITLENRPEQRIAGFETGADDFLSKHVDDLALFARMRSLARHRMLTEELRLREATSAELGLGKPLTKRLRDHLGAVAIVASS